MSMTAVMYWPFLASLTVLVAVIAASTVRTGRLLRTWTPPFNLLLSLPENLLRLGLIGVCVGVGAGLGPGGGPLGWGVTHLVRDLGIGMAVGLALAAGLAPLSWAALRHWGTDIYDDRMLRNIIPASRREWPGVLVALLPAAALEELLFRSLPLGGLGWLISAEWLLWPLALFFGLLHWPQGGLGVAGTTLVAIALSLLFLATGSLWAVLAAHYAMNVAQVVVASKRGIKPIRSRVLPGAES